MTPPATVLPIRRPFLLNMNKVPDTGAVFLSRQNIVDGLGKEALNDHDICTAIEATTGKGSLFALQRTGGNFVIHLKSDSARTKILEGGFCYQTLRFTPSPFLPKKTFTSGGKPVHASKLVISNVPLTVPNEVIITQLEEEGFVLLSEITLECVRDRSGTSTRFKNGNRIVFIVTPETITPTSIKIQYRYRAFLYYKERESVEDKFPLLPSQANTGTPSQFQINPNDSDTEESNTQALGDTHTAADTDGTGEGNTPELTGSGALSPNYSEASDDTIVDTQSLFLEQNKFASENTVTESEFPFSLSSQVLDGPGGDSPAEGFPLVNSGPNFQEITTSSESFLMSKHSKKGSRKTPPKGKKITHKHTYKPYKDISKYLKSSSSLKRPANHLKGSANKIRRDTPPSPT